MKRLMFAITFAAAVLAVHAAGAKRAGEAFTPFQRVNYALNTADSAAKGDKVLVAYIDARARFRRSHDPVDKLIISEIELFYKRGAESPKRDKWRETLIQNIDMDAKFIEALDSSTAILVKRPCKTQQLYDAYATATEKRTKLWKAFSDFSSVILKELTK